LLASLFCHSFFMTVRLAYQPPANTFLLEQTSTGHQPPATSQTNRLRPLVSCRS
jgi:hypothetical protein